MLCVEFKWLNRLLHGKCRWGGSMMINLAFTLCMFLHSLVETAFVIISMKGMKGTTAFCMRCFLKSV